MWGDWRRHPLTMTTFIYLHYLPVVTVPLQWFYNQRPNVPATHQCILVGDNLIQTEETKQCIGTGPATNVWFVLYILKDPKRTIQMVSIIVALLNQMCMMFFSLGEKLRKDFVHLGIIESTRLVIQQLPLGLPSHGACGVKQISYSAGMRSRHILLPLNNLSSWRLAGCQTPTWIPGEMYAPICPSRLYHWLLSDLSSSFFHHGLQAKQNR